MTSAPQSGAAGTADGMDPLLVLPPEVLLKVCAWLPPADLARLFELSRGWRDLAGDRSLWEDAEVDLRDFGERPMQPPLDEHGLERRAAALRALLRAPCLGCLRLPNDLCAKTEEALAKIKPVRRITGFPVGFVFRFLVPILLQRVASRLEELECSSDCDLVSLRLLAEQRLPRLRALSLGSLYLGPDDVAFEPPLPADCGLQRLSVWMGLQGEASVLSLVLAHAATLQELQIAVVHPQFSFADLAVDLRGCGLRALRRLTVVRGKMDIGFKPCDERACREQLRPLRDALGRCAVVCSKCGG